MLGGQRFWRKDVPDEWILDEWMTEGLVKRAQQGEVK
jgi:hypothetical protein